MFSFFKSRRVPQSKKAAPSLYQFREGRIFSPGAEAAVFETMLTNPVYLFRGAGRVCGVINPIQPPQVWFGPQVGVQGVGGIQPGAWVTQPLIDPSQLNSEGGE